MKFEEYNNTIFIVKDCVKNSIIEKISLEKRLINIKVITLSELKKKYFFDYDKRAVYYISKKYDIKPEIAKIYIENLYFIKEMDNPKIKFLKEIREDLINENLLNINSQFKSIFKGKKVILYNIDFVDNFYKNIFEEISKLTEVKTQSFENAKTVKPLYKAANKNEEIAFVASKICQLIKNGVDINKIKIANLQNDYMFAVKNIFKEFNIPIELPNNYNIFGTIITKKFKELYSNDIENTFEELKKFVNDEKDEIIFKKLVNVVNEYSWTTDYNLVKNFIFEDIKSIKLPKEIYKNAVRIIDFPNDIISDDEYVFLMNFNQGIIPANAKDEDYLNDEIKKTLGLSTSIDTNTMRILELQKCIAETSNLIVSYSAFSLTSELYISNAYEETLFENKKIDINYENSDLYNKIRLICAKDENRKFGTITDELIILSNHYDEEYSSYDNSFKGVDSVKLSKFMNNKLTLSYSSMNTYYQCAFRYYINNVLKLDKFEDSFATIIGNLFHKILSECFIGEYDLDEKWEEYINLLPNEFLNSEKYFLKKLKFEIQLVIETIKKQMEYISLNKSLYEQEVKIVIEQNLNITFKGFVDKILYEENDTETIAVIIDYKTGNPELSLDNMPYGLDMQLPVYVYLLKNSNVIKNVRVGGFYLQKILNTDDDIEKRISNLKLQGYSNSDVSILEKVDSSYNDSKLIKSLKTTNNGFYAYSKILSDEEIDKISRIVHDKIVEASNNIVSGNFNINPKQIGIKNVGCDFCKFKDICYLKNSDIVKLKKITKKDFLGGENNAEMDN